MVDVSMATIRLKKSQPCSVTVKIKRLFEESFSYRLFVVLNTMTKTWRYTSPSKYHEVTFKDGSIESSLLIGVSSDQENCVTAPAFLLVKLNDVKMIEVEDILRSISCFDDGQVDYKHLAQTIFYNEEDIVTEL